MDTHRKLKHAPRSNHAHPQTQQAHTPRQMDPITGTSSITVVITTGR
jgi:hypothetical protein